MIGIVNRADKSSATTSSPIQTHGNNVGALPLVASRGGGSEVIKHGKKKPGLRLWMKLDRFGKSQVLECDKNAIIKSVSIPLRDLRILGPLFSHSSNILAREKAIVVNLEFIKAIVTAQEVMLLNPLESKVVDFIDCLKQQFPIKSPTRIDDYNGTITTNQPELPFEFQILEICLETICSFLESSVLELESNAYPILDDLAMNVSTKNLEKDLLCNDLVSMMEAIGHNITNAWSDQVPGWEACNGSTATCVDVYASESINLACNYAYKDAKQDATLEDDYFLSRLPIVEKRIAQGGVRLAALLNQIFDTQKRSIQQMSVTMNLY